MNKVVLCILDGWGYNSKSDYNAIAEAKTPFYNSLITKSPNSLLQASGLSVGLPEGQFGNSEVGHLTLGSGRRIFQDLPRINDSIKSENFYLNPIIVALKNDLANSSRTCHLVGIASNGGVHGHINHLISIAIYLVKHGVKVEIHAITDGRDVSPKSAILFLNQIESAGLKISSISGRYYAMDRDNRTDRTEAAYNTIAKGIGAKFSSITDYIDSNYNNDVFDEFIVPASFDEYSGFNDGDAIFFTNFRADRMRQICSSIISHDHKFSHQIIMRPYSKEISNKCEVIFPSELISGTLGAAISAAGSSQLRIAETEKYAHVTYFFNGGNETPYIGEDRIVIPSPKVDNYETTPQMAAYEITHQVVNALNTNEYDFVCINYSNADMLGHTGNMKAAITSIESLDLCLKGLSEACRQNKYELLITADHGNAECMYDELHNQPLTAHTSNPVPLIYLGPRKIHLSDGELADVAPTVLQLMNISVPPEMSGKSRIKYGQ